MFEITFGMALDGTRWTDSQASIGKMKCGPLGMLKFLETRYALCEIEASDFERIDAYVRKIAAANCDWCRESFTIDPWSTASTLLSWRDELVALKWDGKSCGDSIRLSALARIEAAGPELPMGVADRLVRIIGEANGKVDAQLILVDAFDDLPLIWRDIIRACFEKWEEKPVDAHMPMPKVTVVKGVNEISLARDFARYLSAGSNKCVAVISERETHVLDAELSRLGLPTFGVSDPSRERKPLQELVAALSEYGRTRVGEEYPANEIVTLLDGVTKTLTADIARNPISKLATSHVATLKSKLGGMQTIRRAALWRVVQMIVSEGARCPNSLHELGEVRFLRSPAELTDEVEAALWWSFVPSKHQNGLLFREEEKKLFDNPTSGENAIDDERKRRNRLEARAWERCLSKIKGSLILFVPDVLSGEAAGVHPFYDVLLRKLGRNPEDIEVRDGSLAKDGSWSLAGRSVTLEKKDMAHQEFSDIYKIPPDENLSPKSLSPTQLETLLSCPFQWYHSYYLGLAPSNAAKEETTKTRQGTMAHKMVEELVKASALNEKDVKAQFPKLFDEYCEQLIPEYAEPDFKMERDKYGETLLSSLVALGKLIDEKGLIPCESEYKFPEKDFCGVPFSGRVDLLLKDKDDHFYIFDFKWSSRKDYAEKIKDGTSVQLAAYDWLNGGNSKSGYYLFPVEKFIENTQDNEKVWENVVATYKKRIEVIRSGEVSKAIDIGLEGNMSQARRTQRQEEVQKQGLSIDIHAGCRFCDFKALCGKLWEEGGAE